MVSCASPGGGGNCYFTYITGINRNVHNLGNALEAPNEGEWGVTLQEAYFELIRNAGFNYLRIPIKWSAHALTAAPYTIDTVFLTV
jgi:endoglucanase